MYKKCKWKSAGRRLAGMLALLMFVTPILNAGVAATETRGTELIRIVSEEEPLDYVVGESEGIAQDEVVFYGMDTETLPPGAEIDLLEGLGAYAGNVSLDLQPMEIRMPAGERIALPEGTVRYTLPESMEGEFVIRYGAFLQEQDNALLESASASDAIFAQGAVLYGATAASASDARVLVASSNRSIRTRRNTGVGTLLVSHTKLSTADEYTITPQSGEVGYKGSSLLQDVSGAYVELKTPFARIDTTGATGTNGYPGFKVTEANGIVQSVEYRRESISGVEYVIAKVNLERIINTTNVKVPYIIKFKDDRLTPEDYQLPVDAKFYMADGTLLADAGEVNYSPKYDAQRIDKYLMNSALASNSRDGRSIYGGVSQNGIIINAADVPFMFNMQTRNTSTVYTTAPHIYKQRLLETIVLEDELPLYRNELTGQMVRATFNAASNPGWTVTEYENGQAKKVSYTVNSVRKATIGGGADVPLRENVVLNLRFPGLKVNARGTDYMTSELLTNSVAATLIPYEASLAEQTQPEVVRDEIKFYIDREEINVTGMIDKYPTKRQIQNDPYSMHYVSIPFEVTGVNNSRYPIYKVVMKDFGAHEDLYYKAFRVWGWGGHYKQSNLKEIWGIDGNGMRTVQLYPVAGGDNTIPSGDAWKTIPLDTGIQREIEGYVAQVEAGTLRAENVPAATRTIEGFEVVYDEAVPLNPGLSIRFWVDMGFRDPYHVAVDGRELYNKIAFKGEYTDLNNQVKPLPNIEDRDAVRVVEASEKILFSKSSQSSTGVSGETVGHKITLDFNAVSKGRWFRNPKIIEVLPVGLRYTGFRMVEPANYNPVNLRHVETIENYQDSGRQAVVFAMDDFKPGNIDMPNMNNYGRYFHLWVDSVITEDAIPDPNGTEDSSVNRAYFTADNLYPLPSTMQPEVNATSPGMLPDIYDVDGNAATSEVLGATSKIKINLPRAIRSYKEIRNIGGNWNRSSILTKYGEDFEYGLLIQNTGGSPLSSLSIYDVLPYVGDGAYTGHETRSRNSGFRNALRGAIQVPAGYTVKYSTNPNPNKNPALALQDPAMGWTEDLPADPSAVTAFQITMDTGTNIANNQLLRFVVPMKAAQKPADGGYTDERGINSYVISYDGNVNFGVTNDVYNYFLREITVNKEWSGGTQRPEVQVQLKQNGADYGSAAYPTGRLTLNAANNWSAKYENIPFRDVNGSAYTYTVEEVGAGSGVLANYAASVSGSADSGFTIRNTYQNHSISAEVHWDDAATADSSRPQAVKLRLYRREAGGSLTEQAVRELSGSVADTVWRTTFFDMPKYDVYGNVIDYYIMQEDASTLPALKNYDTSYPKQNGMTGETLIVRNGLVTKSIAVHKLWAGNDALYTRPEEVTVRLQKRTGASAWSDAGSLRIRGTETKRFENLLSYTLAGEGIEYRVQEDAVPNYTASYSADTIAPSQGGAQSIAITNTYQGMDLQVSKEWLDEGAYGTSLRPTSIALALQRKTTAGTWTDLAAAGSLDAAGNWTHRYGDLPKYAPDGTEYSYRVLEVMAGNLHNYTAEYEQLANGDIKIKNRLSPDTLKLRIDWIDENNRFGLRPTSVRVKLQRSEDGGASFTDMQDAGGNIMLTEVYASNDWKHSYQNIRKFDAAGNPYLYRLVEEDSPGLVNYPSVLEGAENRNFTWEADGTLVITNRMQLQSLAARVEWIDDNNALGVRPGSVTIALQKSTDGQQFTDTGIEAVLSADTAWEHIYRNIPLYDEAGRRYTYRIVERDAANLNNYPLRLADGQENRVFSLQPDGVLLVRNTVQSMVLEVQKIWSDNRDFAKVRPQSIRIELLRDGVVLREQDMEGTGDVWTQHFGNLAQYDAGGRPYVYTLREQNTSPFYVGSVNGTRIVNRYTEGSSSGGGGASGGGAGAGSASGATASGPGYRVELRPEETPVPGVDTESDLNAGQPVQDTNTGSGSENWRSVVPKTGDGQQLQLWVLVLLASVGSFSALYAAARRSKRMKKK